MTIERYAEEARWCRRSTLLLLMIVSASVIEVAQSTPEADAGFLQISIQNTVRDLKFLQNLEIQQTLKSRWRDHEGGGDPSAVRNPDHEHSEVFETVIANQKVYVRRVESDGKPIDESARLVGREAKTGQAPDFLSTLMFGTAVPFETIPSAFRIIGRKEDSSRQRTTISIRAEDPKGEWGGIIAQLEVDDRSRRVTRALYTVRNDPAYFSIEIEVTFDTVRGYWLPIVIHTLGRAISGIAVFESYNRITYRKFEAKAKIIN